MSWINKIVCFAVVFSLPAKAQQIIKVQKWNPYDFTFKNASELSNPFTVSFSAEIKGPNGIKLNLPGFYDGNKTWKLRFSPIKEGVWKIKTHSDETSLNNKHADLVCIKNRNTNRHGGLLVDHNNPHHFIYEDGTHWFPIGYECNWLWALDAKDNQLPTLNPFLDKLISYNFNFILINAYCYDTKWRPGKSEEQDYGPSPLYPWKGNNQQPDFSQFNLDYWKHYDAVIEAMYKRGIVAHIYFKVYNKEVNWMKNGSAEDDLYYHWIIARYAAYPNIIWDLAKEANYEKSIEYKVDRLKLIRSSDPYHHLLTVHTDIATFDKGSYNRLVDFRSNQEQSDHLHETTLKQLAQNSWPVMNVESGYEYGLKGPSDKTYSHVNSPEEVATAIWEVQMAGGYNAYYYTNTAWDVIHTNDYPPGYNYLKNFADFFNKTTYWLLKSADSLVSRGYCLENPGKEYVAYQKEAGFFFLNVSGCIKPLKVQWFQPLTGQYLETGQLTNGKIELKPPSSFGTGPVVMHAFD